jgi:hypothetical protein
LSTRCSYRDTVVTECSVTTDIHDAKVFKICCKEQSWETRVGCRIARNELGRGYNPFDTPYVRAINCSATVVVVTVASFCPFTRRRVTRTVECVTIDTNTVKASLTRRTIEWPGTTRDTFAVYTDFTVWAHFWYTVSVYTVKAVWAVTVCETVWYLDTLL